MSCSYLRKFKKGNVRDVKSSVSCTICAVASGFMPRHSTTLPEKLDYIDKDAE
ncbi:hypothetical protein CLOSCI_02852 [[Clostridium] scindens ATCC 35704]|nr:hypothetical protein CLOSCI_02852 [[Clostridium] scindens ATCC 35704]